jgi:cobalt transporter subunit CbtA
MLFQRLIWAALASALLVGSVQLGVQQWQAMPIILAAERYEDQKNVLPMALEVPAAAAPHAHTDSNAAPHDHAASAAWAPDNGAERLFWTWVANVIYALSLVLLMFAVMGVCLWRGTSLRSMPLALGVAAAGWLSFHFWPSLGLPAEIPGMDAARLGSRQGWWLLAAGSAAVSCAALASLRSPLRWVAPLAWLALPFVVGAPHIAADPLASFSPAAQASLRDLSEQFVWATTWISLSFWISMAGVGGAAFEHWLRPAMQTMLARDTAAKPAGKAVT